MRQSAAPCSRLALASAVLCAALATPVGAQTQSNVRALPRVQQAVVVTRDRAVLSAEIGGRLVRIPAGPGARFERGAVLVEIDCRLNRINRDKIRHERDAARKKFENAESLSKLASTGQLTVDLALLDFRRAQSELEAAELLVERCEIRAPFDGAVVRVQAQAHETIAAGQPLVEIAGRDNIELESVVPAAFALRLRGGATLRVRIENLARDFDVAIEGVSPVIDPVSQLVTIRGLFVQPNALIMPGMSGLIQIDP